MSIIYVARIFELFPGDLTGVSDKTIEEGTGVVGSCVCTDSLVDVGKVLNISPFPVRAVDSHHCYVEPK